MENQLNNLMTYTTFHIGVYVSLASALIGAGIFTGLDHWTLRLAIVCMLVAGFSGAMIGSNIPEYASFSLFAQAKLGCWSIPGLSYRAWSILEHGAFWVAILLVSLVYLFQGPDAFEHTPTSNHLSSIQGK